MNIISIILKGYSHLFFQENILFGFLIVAGLAIFSPITLILSLVGNATGVAISYLLVKKPIFELLNNR